MKFIIQPIEKPSLIESLYEELQKWVGYIEDENRRWWVAYLDTEPRMMTSSGPHTLPTNIELNIELVNRFINTRVDVDWVGFAGIQLDKDEKRAMMTPCEVKPEFRGHGLQKKFLQVREDWCRYNGYLTLNSLTFADNIYSANNLIACGYRLRKPFFGSNGKGLYWEKLLKE